MLTASRRNKKEEQTKQKRKEEKKQWRHGKGELRKCRKQETETQKIRK